MSNFMDDLKQEPVNYLFRKVWKHAEGNRRNFIISIILSVLAHSVWLVQPLIFGLLVNELQINGVTDNNLSYVLSMCAGLLGLVFIFWPLHTPSRILERMNAFWVKKNYQMYFYENIFRFDLSWHADRDSGATLDKINNASDNLFNFCQDTYLVVAVLVRAIGTTIILLWFSVWLSVMIAVVTMVSFWVLYQYDKKMMGMYHEMNIHNNTISAKTFDAISNIVTILILRIPKLTLKSIEKSLMAVKGVWRRYIAVNEYKWFAGDVIFTSIIVFPLLYYIYSVYSASLVFEIGTFSALYLYLSQYTEVFNQFGDIYENAIEQRERIKNADDIEDSIRNETLPIREKYNIKSALDIQKLSFSYSVENNNRGIALQDVNLQINRGEKIACIGQSGSGKTTFLKVLHGLYDTATAQLILDGEQIDKQFHEIDMYTTLVPQEPELFSSSVRENITFAQDYSDTQIEEVIALAQFSDVVVDLPNGLDSKINEKGVNLSGGQKQRLALARALLFAQDKEIILLDESTSSVDPENESKIYQNIFDHFAGKTFIASIHKMNLLRYFDRIVMFEDGRVVDEGSFDELLNNNANFSCMWQDFIDKKDN